MKHDEQARLLIEAGGHLLLGNLNAAEDLIETYWPHRVVRRAKGQVALKQKIRTFLDDGCRCRYTGALLFLPPYLTALSVLMPTTFPAHRNGKAELAHDAYWSHFASVDHKTARAKGGDHQPSNLLTTSMALNQLRSRFSLAEFGLGEQATSASDDWDGGATLLLALIDRHPHILNDAQWGKYLKNWSKALREVLQERARASVEPFAPE